MSTRDELHVGDRVVLTKLETSKVRIPGVLFSASNRTGYSFIFRADKPHEDLHQCGGLLPFRTGYYVRLEWLEREGPPQDGLDNWI